MRRLSEINRYDKGRRGAAWTRRRRVERDQYLGLREGLPGHWKAFFQLVSTSVIVDQDYFVLRLIYNVRESPQRAPSGSSALADLRFTV
jgi:hypothetical protein